MTRCFVIGNGPSLNKMNLTLLRNEITFGCNRIYLKYSEMGFAVTHYFVVDSNDVYVIRDLALKYIENPDVKHFYTLNAYKELYDTPKLKIAGTELNFGNVGVLMIREALKAGFDPVYFLGIDMDYFALKHDMIRINTKKCKLKDNKKDGSHFDEEYLQAGEEFVFFENEEEMGFEAFNDIKKEYIDRKGHEVINVGVDGKLNTFKRADFNKILRSKK